MARPKYDMVIEAVHYYPSGEIDWVRVYERRGPTFSDRKLIKRDELIKRLKKGQKAVGGQRLPYLASTFNLSEPLRLVNHDSKEFLISGQVSTERDFLSDVPII